MNTNEIDFLKENRNERIITNVDWFNLIQLVQVKSFD